MAMREAKQNTPRQQGKKEGNPSLQNDNVRIQAIGMMGVSNPSPHENKCYVSSFREEKEGTFT